jgi:flagellar assembly protein FliH
VSRVIAQAAVLPGAVRLRTPAAPARQAPAPRATETEPAEPAEVAALRAELAAAQLDAARLRAQLEASARVAADVRTTAEEEGRSAGYAAGLAAGRQAAEAEHATLLARAAELLRELEDMTPRYLAASEDALVEVVLASVAALLGQGVVLPALVRQAVQAARLAYGAVPMTLVAHPDDLAALEPSVLGGHVSVRPDATVAGCLVETPAGILDARLEQQWIVLRDALLAARAQVEPR